MEDEVFSENAVALITRQPFLSTSCASPPDKLLVALTLASGRWNELLSPEQTAYALAQATALAILPPVEVLDNGSALLEYHVPLRERMSADLVAELVAVLAARGHELHWQQVESSIYVSVIYYGVAACIDITAGAETLYLRYTNQRTEAIYNARYKTEIPLSLSGLQENLYERFDTLLNDVRLRIRFWFSP